MRTLLCALAAIAVLTGCDDATVPESDAGVDSGTDSGAIEPTPDAGCDVSPAPAPLPEIAGGFATDDPDAGASAPMPTGGDPTGTWVVEDATFWVSPQAASMFEAADSMVTGTAWASFEDGEARIQFEFVTTLMGTPAGTIVRPSATRIRGAYTTESADIAIEPACAESSAAMVAPDGGLADRPTLAFTQSEDSITLVTRISSAFGPITIVLTGRRWVP